VLGHEDLFLYRPARVALVVVAGSSALDVLCAAVAARLVEAELVVLLDERAGPYSEPLRAALSPVAFSTLAEVHAALAGMTWDRLRVLGLDPGAAQAELADLAPSIDCSVVHDAGYVELRRYVIEQSRSIARHRHGNLSLALAVRASRGKKAAP